MLPERYCHLLASYLDGELDCRRRRTALRLLRKSRRARAFFHDLQQDSRRLRALVAAVPPGDLSPHVLRAIDARGLRPTADAVPAAAAAPVVRAFPAWVGMALAASILFAVTAGSYLYFSQASSGSPEQPPLAQQGAEPRPIVPVPRVNSPRPEEVPGLRVALRQLASAPERTRLARELRKSTSVHLSLACRDNGQAVERLRSAFQSRGIRLVLDREARQRLGKKNHAVSYLLYAEDLLPEELTAILRHLGTAARGGTSAAPFDTVVVSALTSERRRDVARRLGISPDALRPPARLTDYAPLPPWPDEKIIEGTAKQAGKSVQPPRKGPAGPQRLALVLAYDAASPGPEVREFLRRRRGQRPGSLQVVLVLREARL